MDYSGGGGLILIFGGGALLMLVAIALAVWGLVHWLRKRKARR